MKLLLVKVHMTFLGNIQEGKKWPLFFSKHIFIFWLCCVFILCGIHGLCLVMVDRSPSAVVRGLLPGGSLGAERQHGLSVHRLQ